MPTSRALWNGGVIDSLTARQKKLMDDEFASRKRYEDFLANISD